MANSITDLVKSVDWGKMMSDGDVRNALVGSALGGLVLGGAGLLQDRDPEESRYAPVGDALMGAVLGGVAGYGIPKGLALFRDSGGLAPDDDRLVPNNLAWGTGGGLAGLGIFGIPLYRTFKRTADRLRAGAQRDLPQVRDRAERALEAARSSGASKEQIAHLERKVNILDPEGHVSRAGSVLAERRRARLAALAKLDFGGAKRIGRELKGLERFRNMSTRGYNTVFHDLLNRVASEPAGKIDGVERGRPLGIVRTLLQGDTWRKGHHPFEHGLQSHFWTHGGHYARRAPWWTLGLKSVGPKGHVVARAGKYALGGTLAALLLHKAFGPSATDNYKN